MRDVLQSKSVVKSGFLYLSMFFKLPCNGAFAYTPLVLFPLFK